MASHVCDLTEIPPRSSLRYTRRYSKHRLDGWRRSGDPLADAVATDLHENHGGLTNIHDLLTTVREKARDAADCPLRLFLQESAQKPEWAASKEDEQKIARGQVIHAMHTPFQGLSLFSGSLVGGAQFRTAAVVTALAGNITSDPVRRIRETEANDSLTRVRLLHAALRHWLPRSGKLKPHQSLVPDEIYVEGEVPLNQQDLAITLGVFCYINLRSLRRMGVVLHRDDVDAYVAMWRYAGYVLGIDNELLPRSLEDQEEFMLASMLHQGSPETIPAESTKKFIDAFAQEFSDKSNGFVSYNTARAYLYQTISYLNGPEYVSGMELDQDMVRGDWDWGVLLTRTFGFVFGTFLPRLVPFGLGEQALVGIFNGYTRKMLKRRGTPTGHAAGSGYSRSKL